MKKRCYPKYSYLSFFIISMIMFTFSILPFLFFNNNEIVYKIIWSLMTGLLGIILLINAIISLQYYEINGEFIQVICFGFDIIKLALKDCTFEIQSLPTYFSWNSQIKKEWICIYLKDNGNVKFTSGGSNKKGKNRIQIILSKENLNTIQKYISQNCESKDLSK